jgi:hypothetical protein
VTNVQDILSYQPRTAADRLRHQVFVWKIKGNPTYEEWVDVVEEALYEELQFMFNQRHSLQDMHEDSLTILIVRALSNLGFYATRETKGGNCDLVVQFGDFSWLGEAKIHTGASKIYGGYLQLKGRYGSGLAGQSRGGVLMYCYDREAQATLEEWANVLRNELPNANPVPGRFPLTLHSDDVIPATGLPMKICHYAFPLQYQPLEDVVKLSPAGKAATREVRKARKASAARKTKAVAAQSAPSDDA